MGQDSKIAWTTHTFNGWWGCTKVSAGCAHCYAEGFSKRTGNHVWGDDAPRRFFGDKHWDEPRKWNEAAKGEGARARVFCSSMSDVFEDRYELNEHRDRLWKLIQETPWLDWLTLTKRPENINRMTPMTWTLARRPDNWWAGTTVENMDVGRRIESLLRAYSPVPFLSCEPLLEPLDFCRIGNVHPLLQWHCPNCDARNIARQCAACGRECYRANAVKWVIVGCESRGQSAGRFADGYEAAARSIIEQCQSCCVPVFHKQMPINGKVSHEPAEWPADLRVREFPE